MAGTGRTGGTSRTRRFGGSFSGRFGGSRWGGGRGWSLESPGRPFFSLLSEGKRPEVSLYPRGLRAILGPFSWGWRDFGFFGGFRRGPITGLLAGLLAAITAPNNRKTQKPGEAPIDRLIYTTPQGVWWGVVINQLFSFLCFPLQGCRGGRFLFVSFLVLFLFCSAQNPLFGSKSGPAGV